MVNHEAVAFALAFALGSPMHTVAEKVTNPDPQPQDPYVSFLYCRPGTACMHHLASD